MNQREFSRSLAAFLSIVAAPTLGHGLDAAPNVQKIGEFSPMLAAPAAGFISAPRTDQLPVLNAAAIPAAGVRSTAPALQSPPKNAAGRPGVIAPAAAAASEQIHQALVHSGLHTADALFRGIYDFDHFDRYRIPIEPVAASDGFGGGRGGSGVTPPRKRTGGGGGSGRSGPRIEFADSVSSDHRERLTSALHAHLDRLAEILRELGVPPGHVHNVLLHVDSAQPAESGQGLQVIHYSITVTVHKAHGNLKANFRGVLKAAVGLPEGSLTLSLKDATSVNALKQIVEAHPVSAWQQALAEQAVLGREVASKSGRPVVEFADSIPSYDREWLTSALRAHFDQLVETLEKLGVPPDHVHNVSLHVDSDQHRTARAKVDGVMRSLPSVHYSISVRNARENPEATLGALKAVVVLPEGKLTLSPAPSERLDFLTPPQRYILKYRGPLTPEEFETLPQLREALQKIGARIIQDDYALVSPMLLVEGDATLIQSVLSSRQGWTLSKYEENLVPLPSLHPGLPPLASPIDPAMQKMSMDLIHQLAKLETGQGIDAVIRIKDYIDWPGMFEKQAAPILQYAQVHRISLTVHSSDEIRVHATAEQLHHLAGMTAVKFIELDGTVQAAE